MLKSVVLIEGSELSGTWDRSGEVRSHAAGPPASGPTPSLSSSSSKKTPMSLALLPVPFRLLGGRMQCPRALLPPLLCSMSPLLHALCLAWLRGGHGSH